VDGTSTITIAAQNGFTGTVALSVSATSGLTASLNVTSVTGSGAALLTVRASIGGTYTATVTGTSGSLVHSVLVTVNVQDFQISNNGPVFVLQTQCNTALITITSQAGFSGTVQLATTFVSPGLNATLNPPSVSMSGSSVLNVCAPTAAPSPPNYLVNVTGTSGGLSHTTPVTIVVTTGSNCPDNTSGVCLNPFFNQMSWKHKLSLSKTQNTQTWKFGISNPNNDTLFVQVVINGTDGTGVNGFTASSLILTVNPTNSVTPPLNGQIITFTFPPTDQGDTFTFTAVIHWGTSPTSQPFTSTDSTPGVPTSGSFTIVA
jgi:hypothetical protein